MEQQGFSLPELKEVSLPGTWRHSEVCCAGPGVGSLQSPPAREFCHSTNREKLIPDFSTQQVNQLKTNRKLVLFFFFSLPNLVIRVNFLTLWMDLFVPPEVHSQENPVEAPLLPRSAVVGGALTQGKGGKWEGRSSEGKGQENPVEASLLHRSAVVGGARTQGKQGGRSKEEREERQEKSKEGGREEEYAEQCLPQTRPKAPWKPPLPPSSPRQLALPRPLPRGGESRRLTDVALHGDLLEAAVGPAALGRGGHGGLRGRAAGGGGGRGA